MKTISKLIILMLVSFISKEINGQTFCFTPPTSSNTELSLSALKSSSIASSYCLKIYVHVIRRSNGTGGQSVAEVNQALNFLDVDFNPHNVFFNWDGTIDYINNDSYYGSPSVVIYTVNNHSDGIDIYIYDDSSAAGGRANGVGSSSEFWISGSYWKSPFGSLVKSHVISHEMGHVLFLWHTHHGTSPEGGDPAQCAELVNGSNANTCGDYVTDTPADPHLHFNVNSPACTWTSSGTDANGDSYNPDETLVMAYTHPDCMSYFSMGQGQRIRNAIATLPHLINSTVPCGIPCDPNLLITQNVSSIGVDHQQAEFTITATNSIASGGEAIYHAGEQVLLANNFTASNGSVFRAYIEACTGNFEKKLDPIAQDVVEPEVEQRVQETSLGQNIKIYPNPTKGVFDFTLKDIALKDLHVQIFSANGKLMYQKRIKEESTKSFQVDISHAPIGIYFFKLTDGQRVLTRKIIKIN